MGPIRTHLGIALSISLHLCHLSRFLLSAKKEVVGEPDGEIERRLEEG